MKTKKNKGRRKAKPLTKAEWAAEQELRNKLQTERWPEGFVCPHCDWRHTEGWAREKAKRIKERFRGPKPDLAPGGLRQTWYLKDGKIKCQRCGRHISLTTGTVLERIQQKKQREAYQSKFDMDPDDVNIRTIKDLLAGTGKKQTTNDDQAQRKPINKP